MALVPTAHAVRSLRHEDWATTGWHLAATTGAVCAAFAIRTGAALRSAALPVAVGAGGMTLVYGTLHLLSGTPLPVTDALLALPTYVTLYAPLLPDLVALGLGVGMVFVPVSVTAMAGIPERHAGLASGFLMTGHEVGAALGVAVLSAAANTAGSLVDPARVVDAVDRGLLVAGAVAAALALFAWLRPPATAVADAGGAHTHH